MNEIQFDQKRRRDQQLLERRCRRRRRIDWSIGHSRFFVVMHIYIYIYIV